MKAVNQGAIRFRFSEQGNMMLKLDAIEALILEIWGFTYAFKYSTANARSIVGEINSIRDIEVALAELPKIEDHFGKLQVLRDISEYRTQIREVGKNLAKFGKILQAITTYNGIEKRIIETFQSSSAELQQSGMITPKSELESIISILKSISLKIDAEELESKELVTEIHLANARSKLLVESILIAPHLISIGITNSGIRDVSALKGMGACLLTKINLWGNNITGKQIQGIKHALIESKLEIANFGKNKLGDLGAKVLAKVLLSNSSLTSLNISLNNIGDRGAIKIAAAITQNNALLWLSLGNNKIGEAGVHDISRSLKHNRSLKYLGLECNILGDSEYCKLAKCLAINTSLTSINLMGRTINADTAKQIVQLLMKNDRIESLNLNYIGLDLEVAARIQRLLEVNILRRELREEMMRSH